MFRAWSLVLDAVYLDAVWLLLREMHSGIKEIWSSMQPFGKIKVVGMMWIGVAISCQQNLVRVIAVQQQRLNL
jgi:hypothetical protein